MQLTQELLQQTFIYRGGKLYWRISPGRRVKAGRVFGFINNQGYRCGGFLGKSFKHSRLVFLFVRGYMPQMIDHINRNKSDDRIENLRAVSTSENRINSSCCGKIKHKYISYLNVGKYTYFYFSFRLKRKYVFCKLSLIHI